MNIWLGLYVQSQVFVVERWKRRLESILLALKLGQQSRKRRSVCLVNASAGDQLVDQVLYILPAQRSQRRGGNVEQTELVRYVYPDVAHKCAADFIGVD